MARKKSKQQGVGAKDLVSGQQQLKKPGDAGAAAAGGGAGGGGDAGASRTNQVTLANANTYNQQHTSLSRFALLATCFLIILMSAMSRARLHVRLFVFSRFFSVL